MFFYYQQPSPENGQTAILRSDVLAKRMEEELPEVVAMLAEEGIRKVVRTATGGQGDRKQGWQQMFKTEDEKDARQRFWSIHDAAWFRLHGRALLLFPQKPLTQQEFVASLRRHHQHGRWQTRIGTVVLSNCVRNLQDDDNIMTTKLHFEQNTGMGGRTRASQGLVASRFAFSLQLWCIDRGWPVVVLGLHKNEDLRWYLCENHGTGFLSDMAMGQAVAIKSRPLALSHFSL
ncbi:hypothetical protein Taro_012276 [Colocasia esculenta]|uniref:Uncharacterized protein n=1 Tax=Colocasia esculenta TaxID=4460 RepID=A0A843U8L4_COLES|nr:hypothetical protein [Colocasia esculenta]